MIPKTLVLAAMAAALAAQGAPATAAGYSGNCFSLHQMQSTRPDGDQRIYARVGLHDIYRFDLAFRCPALLSQEGLVVEPAGGKDSICSPLDLEVRARELGGGSTSCNLKSITRLTPEEAAALPPKVRP